jgi:pyridoxal biosynthesis lyase PdxS
LLTNVVPQARIAEEAGASAVMALERVPADIRSQGGVARMSDPKMIKEIMDTVTIPVMAKARIGHFVECQVRLDDLQLFCLEADPHFQHLKDPFANAYG